MATLFTVPPSVGPTAVQSFGPFTLPDGTGSYIFTTPIPADLTTGTVTTLLEISKDGGTTWQHFDTVAGMTVGLDRGGNPLTAFTIRIQHWDLSAGWLLRGHLAAVGQAVTFAGATLTVDTIAPPPAHHSIALVTGQNFFVSTASGTGITHSFTNPTGAGNLISFLNFTDNSGGSTVNTPSDDKTNSYAAGITAFVFSAGADDVGVWYAKNCASGTQSMTGTWTATTDGAISCQEWSGVDTSSPKQGETTPLVSGGTQADAQGNSITPGVNGCLILSLMMIHGGTGASTSLSPWTSLFDDLSEFGGSFQYQVQGTAAAVTGDYNITNADAISWDIASVVFTPPGSVVTTTPGVIFFSLFGGR